MGSSQVGYGAVLDESSAGGRIIYSSRGRFEVVKARMHTILQSLGPTHAKQAVCIAPGLADMVREHLPTSCVGASAPHAAGAASLRQRLHQLLTPLLRLVLAIVTALPNSSAVREQALAFVDAHGRTLTRVLHDAASPGIRWGCIRHAGLEANPARPHTRTARAQTGGRALTCRPALPVANASGCSPQLLFLRVGVAGVIQYDAIQSDSSSCRGWEPGDAELEEATLAVQLLAELAPVRDLLQAGPQLQEAAYRLSTR